MDFDSTEAVNDSARASKDLSIKRVPQVNRMPMPHMSDNELYLRLNVPDGLQNNGKWPEHYGIPQDEAAHGQDSIRHNNDDADGGVARKLAGANAALNSANNFQASAGGPLPKAPKQRNVTPDKIKNIPTQQGPSSSGSTLANELRVKRQNVEDYEKANQ